MLIFGIGSTNFSAKSCSKPLMHMAQSSPNWRKWRLNKSSAAICDLLAELPTGSSKLRRSWSALFPIAEQVRQRLVALELIAANPSCRRSAHRDPLATFAGLATKVSMRR